MPLKPKSTLVPAPPQAPCENVTEHASPKELPLTSIVIAEPPSRLKRKAATKEESIRRLSCVDTKIKAKSIQ